jgi:hypothetical protein
MCRNRATPASRVQPVTVAAKDDFQGKHESTYSIGPSVEPTNSREEPLSTTEKSFQIGAVDGAGAVWQMQLTNGRSIEDKLDTGARANILPYTEYQRLVTRPRLQEVKSRLFAYGIESPIQVKGQCSCDISKPGGGTRKPRFYVLAPTVRAVPLLGLRACDEMNLIRRVETAVTEQSDLEEVCRDHSYCEKVSGFVWQRWKDGRNLVYYFSKGRSTTVRVGNCSTSSLSAV